MMMITIGYLFLNGMVTPMDLKSLRINISYFDLMKVLLILINTLRIFIARQNLVSYNQSFIIDKITAFGGSTDTDGESCWVNFLAILKLVFLQ